ncbi:hypothetical protein HYT32_02160 [Candidatus Roizmanbacteria bacterium]|nr:hypothetical protein [Candidatus Roizmanbacteria bacterium]
MLIDFFASLSFYIIPYLTGRLFVKRTFQAWILGALLWFVAYFLVSGILGVLKINYFSSVIRYLAIGICIISIAKIIFSFIKERPRINIRVSDLLTGVFLTFFTSLVYFLIWKRNTPYPLQLNWDIYEHITLANLIVSGKLSFFTTQISDTFTLNSYSPMFGILLSLPKIIFQKNILGIYWWLEYWYYLLTALASFMIAKRLFNDKWLAVIFTITSSLVFESIVAYTTLFLLPQTLVALLTIFIILHIKEHKIGFLALVILVVTLLHYVVGILCLFVLVAFYLILRLGINLSFLNKGVLIATLALLSSIVLNFLGKWQVLEREEAAHFNFTILQKLGFLVDWYGITIFIFAVIGYIKIVKGKSYSEKIILIVALLIFGISFAPFSYFLKFYVLGHYFINLIVVAGIGVLLANLPITLKSIGSSFLVLLLVITFYKNQLAYKEPLRFEAYDTQISVSEIKAGEFLSSFNKDGTAFIISDPSLQYILEAISGINTQGGAYMDLQTRIVLDSINGVYNTEFIINKLSEIHDLIPDAQKQNRKILFVIGGRYFAWQRLTVEQKEKTFYNVWSPRKLMEDDIVYLDFLISSLNFKIVYRNDEIAILEVI